MSADKVRCLPRLDFEYHARVQNAVFAAIEQEFEDVSVERKRRIHTRKR